MGNMVGLLSSVELNHSLVCRLAGRRRPQEFPIEFVNLIKTRGQCSILNKFNFDPPSFTSPTNGPSSRLDGRSCSVCVYLYQNKLFSVVLETFTLLWGIIHPINSSVFDAGALERMLDPNWILPEGCLKPLPNRRGTIVDKAPGSDWRRRSIYSGLCGVDRPERQP